MYIILIIIRSNFDEIIEKSKEKIINFTAHCRNMTILWIVQLFMWTERVSFYALSRRDNKYMTNNNKVMSLDGRRGIVLLSNRGRKYDGKIQIFDFPDDIPFSTVRSQRVNKIR